MPTEFSSCLCQIPDADMSSTTNTTIRMGIGKYLERKRKRLENRKYTFGV